MNEDDLHPLESRPRRASIHVAGFELRPGDRVRLHPQRRADILDVALEQQTAVIDAIEDDYDGNVFLAVVLDDDPGRDLGLRRHAGHRFFFAPEEVEPLAPSTSHTGDS